VTGLLCLLLWRALAWQGQDERHWADRDRHRALILFICLLGFQAISGSRTFIMAFGGAAAGLTAYWFFGWFRPHAAKALGLLMLPNLVQAAGILLLIQNGLSTASVSDLTRSSNIIASTGMWQEKPLLGHGLGQYGFVFTRYVPSYAGESWELRQYIDKRSTAFMMPSYNLYGRMAGELGTLGLVTWSGFLTFAMARLMRFGAALTGSGRRRARWNGGILLAGICALSWTGTSFDSFRTFYLWIFIGIGVVLVAGREWAAGNEDAKEEESRSLE
jgi:hypothetical protein